MTMTQAIIKLGQCSGITGGRHLLQDSDRTLLLERWRCNPFSLRDGGVEFKIRKTRQNCETARTFPECHEASLSSYVDFETSEKMRELTGLAFD